jgi:integrase
MGNSNANQGYEQARTEGPASNVKSLKKRPRYERFGETIRYLTIEELQQFFDAAEKYRHKLMMQMIYELGCRVGEFVRIQLKHLSFGRGTVYFPAANTKTKARRVSHLPAGLMNEVKSQLRRQGRMAVWVSLSSLWARESMAPG